LSLTSVLLRLAICYITVLSPLGLEQILDSLTKVVVGLCVASSRFFQSYTEVHLPQEGELGYAAGRPEGAEFSLMEASLTSDSGDKAKFGGFVKYWVLPHN
jgi:hypothetical protein